jgi:Flp pilus assembly protein TadG
MGKRKVVRQKGQALVELALTLPLILLLILGAMDFGRLFTTKLVMNNAAREGAYFVTTYPCDALDDFAATISAALTEANGLGVELTAADITVTYNTLENGCITRGDKVTVNVSQAVDLIFDGPLQALGLITGPITLSSDVSMVVQ